MRTYFATDKLKKHSVSFL